MSGIPGEIQQWWSTCAHPHPYPEASAAADLYATELATGCVPGIGRIRREMHVGSPRAVRIRAYLRSVAAPGAYPETEARMSTPDERSADALAAWVEKLGPQAVSQSAADGFRAGFAAGFAEGEEYGWESKAT